MAKSKDKKPPLHPEPPLTFIPEANWLTSHAEQRATGPTYPPILLLPELLPSSGGDYFFYIDVDVLKREVSEIAKNGGYDPPRFQRSIENESPHWYLCRELASVLHPILRDIDCETNADGQFRSEHQQVPGSYQDRLRVAAVPPIEVNQQKRFNELFVAHVLNDDLKRILSANNVPSTIQDAAKQVYPQGKNSKPLALNKSLKRLFAQGRSLICSGYDGRYVCITLRMTESNYGPESIAVPNEGENALVYRKWKNTPDRFLPFPVIIETLFENLFPKASESMDGHKGVIVISGETGCGKTQITMGLIATILHRLVAGPDANQKWRLRDQSSSPRRFHFLTIEDQIETFYKPDPHTSIPDELGRAWRQGLVHQRIEDIGFRDPTSPLIKEHIHYTPRLIGRDVKSLKDGLTDALRQKPALVYLGEVRQPNDLKAMIEFGATGHLVVATMHAGSLTGTMEKLIRAYSGHQTRTPAQRGEVAQSILAAIHLQRFVSSSSNNANMIAPAVWRQSELGIAGLVGEGLGSILPHCVENMPSHGRQYFLRKIRQRFQKNEMHLEHPEHFALFDEFDNLVANSDLGGI